MTRVHMGWESSRPDFWLSIALYELGLQKEVVACDRWLFQAFDTPKIWLQELYLSSKYLSTSSEGPAEGQGRRSRMTFDFIMISLTTSIFVRPHSKMLHCLCTVEGLGHGPLLTTSIVYPCVHHIQLLTEQPRDLARRPRQAKQVLQQYWTSQNTPREGALPKSDIRRTADLHKTTRRCDSVLSSPVIGAKLPWQHVAGRGSLDPCGERPAMDGLPCARRGQLRAHGSILLSWCILLRRYRATIALDRKAPRLVC